METSGSLWIWFLPNSSINQYILVATAQLCATLSEIIMYRPKIMPFFWACYVKLTIVGSYLQLTTIIFNCSKMLPCKNDNKFVIEQDHI